MLMRMCQLFVRYEKLTLPIQSNLMGYDGFLYLCQSQVCHRLTHLTFYFLRLMSKKDSQKQFSDLKIKIAFNLTK
jgi:hypothetical protein